MVEFTEQKQLRPEHVQNRIKVHRKNFEQTKKASKQASSSTNITKISKLMTTDKEKKGRDKAHHS